jgi:AcrR family transcriptional regulator
MKLTDMSTDGSGLREKHKSRTRENILQAVATRLERDGLAQLSFAEIAREAEIGESTIYRYFPNKDALLEAFWAWAPAAIKRDRYPRTFDELASRLEQDFKSFDRKEPLIRGMLASPMGRASRMKVGAERQAAFKALVTHEAGELPEEELLHLAATIQMLYSATAWATYKDYWSMDGEAAARTAIAAIRALLDNARRR